MTATALAVLASESSATPPRLIVRGDDMGYAHAANVATIEAWRNGIETSIEVIVPGAWFPEAVRLLEENPGVDVGVHLVLTSEWDTLKWRPLTRAPSLVDDDGFFFPMIWPNANYPGRALREHAWSLAEIEQEFRAQIELAWKRIPRVSHLSGHMGCTRMDPQVVALTRRLAQEYGLDIDLGDHGVESVTYVGEKRTAEDKVSAIIRMLESLQSGKTYCFVDHPGLDTPEQQAVRHIGYPDVAADRQGVTAAWTDPRVKETVKRLGIELIGYRDLRRAGK